MKSTIPEPSTSSNDQLALRQLQSGVDSLSEGFALFGSSEKLVTCNAAFRSSFPDLTNYLRPGSTWAMFLLEALRHPGNNSLQEIDAHLISGLNTVLEAEPMQQGHRMLQLTVQPFEDDSFVITVKDIADQHRAHHIIEHAGDLLRDVLDACASRIAVSSISDGRLLYSTPAWRSTFGKAKHLQDTFADELTYTDLLTEVLASGRADDLDVSMYGADSTPLPARLFARAIDYQDEESIVISTEDMSQLYKQRDEIVSTNQRLVDAIEALDQGFVLFDNQHKLVLANRHYRDANAPIVDKLIQGVSNDNLVAAAINSSHEPSLAGWSEPDGGNVNDKYECELADERVYSVSRGKTSDGGFLMTSTDITGARRIENELNKQREAAFQSEKLNALGQLLAGVAHELNNPLSVVVGHAMMLKDELSDSNALDGVERISRSAERCAKIVKTFLAMARQKPMSMLDIRINEVVENALEITAYGMRRKGINIELQLGSDLPAVSGDEDQITQVLINLMLNAEQAFEEISGQAEKILISTFQDIHTGAIIARVSDNGKGIPTDLRVRIFEPFFTTKSVNEGTGVGLALCHRIATSHNGQLELVDSELGGATFELSLPISTSLVSTKDIETDAIAADKQRALVVEDEPEVAHVMKMLLERIGMEPITVNSGKSAISLLQKDSEFAVVLCDLRMPHMSGRELSQHIEKSWPALGQKIIFVTGDAISEDADWIRRQTDYPLLEKPVSPSDLDTALHPILAQNKAALRR